MSYRQTLTRGTKKYHLPRPPCSSLSLLSFTTHLPCCAITSNSRWRRRNQHSLQGTEGQVVVNAANLIPMPLENLSHFTNSNRTANTFERILQYFASHVQLMHCCHLQLILSAFSPQILLIIIWGSVTTSTGKNFDLTALLSSETKS